MIKNITQNELLLLTYNELPPTEHREILKKVLSNPELTKQYKLLLEKQDLLDTVSYSPHPTSVQIIKERSLEMNALETI